MHAYGVSFDAGIYSVIFLTAMMLSIFSIGLAFPEASACQDVDTKSEHLTAKSFL